MAVDAGASTGDAGPHLLFATMTRGFVARHAAMHRRLGIFPPGYPRPVDDDAVALSVELDDDELRAKRAALAAHASQTDSLALAMGENAFATWWATESFRRPTAAELRPTELECQTAGKRRSDTRVRCGSIAP